MMGCMSCDPRAHRTVRLDLSPLAESDGAAVFRITGDAATWAHLPSARHRTPADAVAAIAASTQSWREAGLGAWAVRARPDAGLPGIGAGAFLGLGGATAPAPGLWNLGYRLAPAAWGLGLAGELAGAAVAAAAAADATRAVTARILSNNPASARVAERVGLALIWEGPSRAPLGGGDPPALRRIYADREPGAAALAWLIANA